MSDWKTLSGKELEALLNGESSKEPYKFVGHSFTLMKLTGKQYCTRCGLVAGKSQITQWCVDKGCNHEDHPQYKKKLKKLTKRKWQEWV